MKKFKATITVTLMVMVLTVLMVTSAFATNNKTIEVKGYTWEDITEEQLAKVESNFSVSNVIDTFDAKMINSTTNDGLIVDGNTTITLQAEGGVIFEAYKLTNKDKLEYDAEKPLPVSGKATIYVDDAETGEQKKKTIDLSELDNYDVGFPAYLPGCTITLTEPGDYYVCFRYEAIAGSAEAIITVKDTKQERSKIVEVKGYIWENMSDEELAKVKPNFSVSNVVDTFDPTSLQSQTRMSACLITEAPVTITLMESASDFEITKLKDKVNMIAESDGSISVSGLDVGCNATLTEPGDYYIRATYKDIGGEAEAVITVKDATETVENNPVVEALIANPTSSNVLVNGANTSFDAYTINGNNYFKIRDLANVLSGTEKQFDVTWNTEKKVINLISNKTYTVVGGEMAKGDNQEKTPEANTSPIYKDGKVIELTAYTINGNNYFKLRDIAKVFDIGITWNNETKTIGIDTSIGYIEP